MNAAESFPLTATAVFPPDVAAFRAYSIKTDKMRKMKRNNLMNGELTYLI